MHMHVCTVLFIHFSLLYKVAILNFSNKRFIIIIMYMEKSMLMLAHLKTKFFGAFQMIYI